VSVAVVSIASDNVVSDNYLSQHLPGSKTYFPFFVGNQCLGPGFWGVKLAKTGG
jgi:hypothetical protein